MNQEQNNLNTNNFNTQGNNGIPNNQSSNNQIFNQQPINPQSQPISIFQQPITPEHTSQTMNTLESGSTNKQSFNQDMNINQQSINNQPLPTNNQMNNMQTNNQEMQQQMNLGVPNNTQNKPKKNIGLIIGIIIGVIAIVIIAILLLSKLLPTNTNSENLLNGNKEEITSKGKIPYNKEINSCALSNVEYKDNTRNLCDNPSDWFTSKSNGLIYGTIYYNNFTFYINTDESNILSYKRTDDDLYGYEFINVFKDETEEHYIYLFYEMENNNYIYITDPSVDKIVKDVDFINATTKQLENGKTIEKGNSSISGYKNAAYRYNATINDLNISIIYLGETDAELAYNRATNFSNLLSMDDGSPFLFDLVIAKETINDYYVKSYKYIAGLRTEANIRGEKYTDLHYNLSNNNVTYSFSDTSSYMPDFFKKYDVHKVKMLSNDKIIHGTFIPEDNEFMISIELIDKYYATNVDQSLGAEYYINNYTEMLVSKDGKGFGPVEKYES